MEFHVFSIPMVTRFRSITHREGVLISANGRWAEFSPFLEYSDEESVPWWKSALEMLEDEWPEPRRDSIDVNCIVPAVGPEHAIAIVESSSGCTTAKVKVAEPGQSIAEDIDRVSAVRAALGSKGKIRLDANGAWDVAQAVDAIARLDRAAQGLEYVEQPVATVADLARVRKATRVAIAADESIRRADDPFEVARLNAADIAVLKVQPLGGVRAALDIAGDINMPVVVSSAVETSVGISAGLALAAALPELEYACGLATTDLLAGDVVSDSLRPTNGQIAVGRVQVDEHKLERYRASSQTTAAWLKRIESVKKVVGS